MPGFTLSLAKLFDEAILPAFLVVGTKVITFLIIAVWTGMIVEFPKDITALFLLPPSLDYTEKLIFANSVSSLFTLMLILAYFGWVIIKAHHFHETHISPRFHQKLVKNGLAHLVQESDEIYHQGLVWLTLSWAFFFHLLSETAYGIVFWWVPLIATAVVFALTMMMIEDVINELKFHKAGSKQTAENK